MIMNPEVIAANYLEKTILRHQIVDLILIGKGKAESLDFTLKDNEFICQKNWAM